MLDIENIEKRIAKAESLPKEDMEKYLFDYLDLKDKANSKIDDDTLWKILCVFIVYVEDRNVMSVDNLSNFLKCFEEDYKKSNNKFNMGILIQFLVYICKEKEDK